MGCYSTMKRRFGGKEFILTTPTDKMIPAKLRLVKTGRIPGFLEKVVCATLDEDPWVLRWNSTAM